MSNSFATPWTVPHQPPLSMGFPRQEYWSGLPFPSPGDLPDSGIDPAFSAWQEDSLLLSHQGSPNIILQQKDQGSLENVLIPVLGGKKYTM